MSVLQFFDGRWEIATGGWTVGSPKAGDNITVCYPWSSSGTMGLGGSTGTAMVELPLTMETFNKVVAKAKGGPIDLRAYRKS